jgi:AbrB family looped-hinge helix DNA binding protein
MWIPEGYLGSVKVSSKGQITIPQRARDRLGLDAGIRVQLSMEGGRLLVERPKQPSRPLDAGDELRELLFWVSELLGRAGRLVDEISPEEPAE